MALNPGTQVGAYQIVGPLGAGAMGEVYRAHDARAGLLRSRSCRKSFPATQTACSGSSGKPPPQALSITRTFSPYLAIYDIGTHEGSPFIVSELLSSVAVAEVKHGKRPNRGAAIKPGRSKMNVWAPKPAFHIEGALCLLTRARG